MKDLDVLVVGGVGVDTIVRVPELPLPVRDSIMVPRIESYVGHTGNGVALGCHRLGLRTRFVDVIGADPEGERVLANYRKAEVSFGYQVHPSGTRRSVNLVDSHGQRVSLYDGRHPFDMTVGPELYQPDLERTRHAHISIMNWARVALADAVAAGVPTSTDLHDWDGKSDYHADFAFGADLVFFSTTALGDRVEKTMVDILARGRAKVVVAMAGSMGSYIQVGNAEVQFVPIAELADCPVVDTNGAGDSYVAGFLYAYLNGEDWSNCARIGAIAGAFSCGSPGTHTSFVDRDRLEQELA